MALAHLCAAQMLNLDGRFAEAGRHLARADRLFLLGADQSDLGILRAEQAIRAAALEEDEQATALANEAARLLGDDARHRALKWRALASAHRLAGDVDQADRYFGKALGLLKERRRWREGLPSRGSGRCSSARLGATRRASSSWTRRRYSASAGWASGPCGRGTQRRRAKRRVRLAARPDLKRLCGRRSW